MTTFRTRIPNHFDLPRRIARLGELAYNLWWTWNPNAYRLFSRIDMALWERLAHNPIKLLRQVDRATLNAVAQDAAYVENYDRVLDVFDKYLADQNTWAVRTHPDLIRRPIAYFSMEYGLHETLPIYSGGLGVLAGDHLKEASDLGLTLIGVGFLYREGYFSQHISEDGWQDARNNPLDFAELPVLPVLDENDQPLTLQVEFPERAVRLRLWEIRVGRVPLYLMDAGVEGNTPEDQKLTARLYWSDLERRIMQEILLGVGGVRALRLLGHNPSAWHMNEGHAAFLILERARELVAQGKSFDQAICETSKSNVFTTHTPVPAGNDEFPLWLIDKYLSTLWPALELSREQIVDLARNRQQWGDTFSMGILALRHSEGRNAVSELHGHVSRRMWHFLWPEAKTSDDVPITYITNGVHTANWIARRLRMLYDRYLGEDWLEEVDNPAIWERIELIPPVALWAVRQHLKRKLVYYIRERARQAWLRGEYHPVQVVASGVLLDPYALTIGFARRFATYKRAGLLLNDFERVLRLINRPNRPVQIIFAGKAHPADEPGKQLIQQIYRAVKRAETGGRLVFLEDYDMNLARYLVQGVDVWVNTPRRPNEASGTSGMKAGINGALNFSVLDGWWREAYNGRNGWAIGSDRDPSPEDQDADDAMDLYATLENEIVPLYYKRTPEDLPLEWIERMKESLRTVTPQFSTRRMLKEYVERLYLPASQAAVPEEKMLENV